MHHALKRPIQNLSEMHLWSSNTPPVRVNFRAGINGILIDTLDYDEKG